MTRHIESLIIEQISLFMMFLDDCEDKNWVPVSKWPLLLGSNERSHRKHHMNV